MHGAPRRREPKHDHREKCDGARRVTVFAVERTNDTGRDGSSEKNDVGNQRYQRPGACCRRRRGIVTRGRWRWSASCGGASGVVGGGHVDLLKSQRAAP
eukprot:2217170-Pleurochrysis_carterae.AAC.1